jgi:hypothetical protein
MDDGRSQKLKFQLRWAKSVKSLQMDRQTDAEQNLTEMLACAFRFLKCKTNTILILMHQMHISTTQVSSVMLRSKKLEIREKNVKTVKEPMKTKESVMKLSQIRRRT